LAVKVLLDTNGYSAFLQGKAETRHVVMEAEEVFLSVFVLGELHAGFRKGTKMRQNLDILQDFLDDSRVRVLDATAETAEVFGLVKSSLEKAGTPLPVHDMWIAAQAMQTGSVVVTYDRHFLQMPGLRVWDGLESR
jgi:tRNA(fMet)-specific endonuclease VapC